MITTQGLIASLSVNPAPVRRLRPPLLRACCWLAVAALVLVLLGISHGLRPDFAKQLADRAYVVGLLASLLTGVLATVAASLTSLPLSLALLVMLRYTAWLRPVAVIWMDSVAVGALTASALSCSTTLTQLS